jgi:hypothetical protein
MDNEEFLSRLTELAELQVIKVAGPAQRKPDEHLIVWRNGQEYEIDDKANPTLYYRIKKIKNNVRKCEDCGRRVKERIVTKKLLSFPVVHWRQSCNTCKMYQHPETGDYCLVGLATQSVWLSWLKLNHPALMNQPQCEISSEQPELAPVEKKPAK